MVMGRQLSLNKSLDSTILKGEAQDKVNEGEKLDELGAKFVSDKEKLEAEIDKVEKSNISNADKSKLLDCPKSTSDNNKSVPIKNKPLPFIRLKFISSNINELLSPLFHPIAIFFSLSFVRVTTFLIFV